MKTRVMLVVWLALLSVASCEMVFTTSPLAFLQRDPSRLSEQQQVVFGRNALASGDREKMAVAFELLKESADPEIRLLASDLAFGAAGLDVAIMSALPDIVAAGDDQAALQAALDEALMDFSADDLSMMAAAAALVAGAEGAVTPAPEQYLTAAVGLVAIAASLNAGVGGLETLAESDPGYAEVEQAKTFLQSAADGLHATGQSTAMLDGIGDAVGWTP